jgi:hypothetical protein
MPASAERPADTSFAFPAWAGSAAWAFAAVVTAVGLAIWVPQLVDRAARAPLPAPVRVVLQGQPAWLPPDERAAIERSVVRSIAQSPFNRDGLAKARDAVATAGWMSSVTQVRRSDVDEVVVEGTWSVPFALVRDADGEHLVDTRGRLLPRSYPAGKGPRLLRIEGVSAPRPASFGSTWPGDEVAAALSMAAGIADRPWRHQVTVVVMDRWAEDGTIRLRTDRGGEITWGHAPGRETVSEVPAIQKLGALQLAWDRTGHIDGGAAESLDLRGDVTLGR